MEAGSLVTVGTPEEFVNSTEPLVTAYVDAFGTNFKNDEKRGHP
jgi:hypothetical protein